MNDNTEYEVIDGKTNAPMSIEEKIKTAASGEELVSLLNFGLSCKPSSATRRRWLRARAVRYAKLRARPAQGTGLQQGFALVSSENSENTAQALVGSREADDVIKEISYDHEETCENGYHCGCDIRCCYCGIPLNDETGRYEWPESSTPSSPAALPNVGRENRVETQMQ